MVYLSKTSLVNINGLLVQNKSDENQWFISPKHV